VPLRVTKLDPGRGDVCGGDSERDLGHETRAKLIYFDAKTQFMDGPTSRSVPCNWPPPGHVTLSHTYIFPDTAQQNSKTRCSWVEGRPGVPDRQLWVFGLWRVCFPPCLVRPGRRLPVQGLNEGSLGFRDRLPAWRGPGTGLKICHQGYQKSKRNLVYGFWSQ